MLKKIITVIICLIILSPVILFETVTFIMVKFTGETYTNSTEAVVVDNVQAEMKVRSKSGGHHYVTVFQPVVEFEYNGKEYTVQVPYGESDPVPTQTTMEIRFNPDDPNDVYNPQSEKNFLPWNIGVGIFGLLELIIMIIVIRGINKVKKSRLQLNNEGEL